MLGRKWEIPKLNHLTHRQAKLGLSHMCYMQLLNPHQTVRHSSEMISRKILLKVYFPNLAKNHAIFPNLKKNWTFLFPNFIGTKNFPKRWKKCYMLCVISDQYTVSLHAWRIVSLLCVGHSTVICWTRRTMMALRTSLEVPWGVQNLHLLSLCWVRFEPYCEKPNFCLWENKDTDQLRSNCKADQL